ncbi:MULTISPECIES: YkoP family protein [Tepidibacillus]|uniref:YkoP-like domain-containing protein n=1 Tax=Tepidibacillus decaturensis TaxID=1413211 RepID=A0A135L2N4_9BACI|nr:MULTISPECIES: hypothetical protein [Tepidibacillus]KXG43241.1 hypothetical protein U473_03840 [Tepidibacillus decaturensis]GBF10983.1 hypothetical protein HK1_01000 [Tepidibacillus sp. HK-1]
MNAGLLQAWRAFDFIYQHMTRLEYVDKENGNIFRVVFCKYHGPDLVTRDGTHISKGDPIVKLHIHNWGLANRLQGINNEARLGLITFRIVKDSLPTLATYIEHHPKGNAVKAVIGTTFLHRGVNRLGFDVHPVPDLLRFRIKNQYLKLILFLIHPNGIKRLKRKPEELVLKRVYISKNHLLNQYGTASQQMEELM